MYMRFQTLYLYLSIVGEHCITCFIFSCVWFRFWSHCIIACAVVYFFMCVMFSVTWALFVFHKFLCFSFVVVWYQSMCRGIFLVVCHCICLYSSVVSDESVLQGMWHLLWTCCGGSFLLWIFCVTMYGRYLEMHVFDNALVVRACIALSGITGNRSECICILLLNTVCVSL